ncbi:MAG: DsbA family protein [Gammaproteobacteria bacterium]|nr:DsbA family protein [Gammaproteobacteria bacterium]
MKLNRTLIAIAVASGLAYGSTAFAKDQNATLSDTQKTQIEGVVHDYLMKNPEVIADAVKGLQEKQFDQMRKKTQDVATKNEPALFNTPNDPVAGNPKGKVTVVEFFDYQCPHCVDMVPALNGLVKANGEVRVIYKEFPIRGPMSVTASKAALAANVQGKYMPMHEALMKSASSLTEEKIYSLAKDVGLDVEKLKADMKGDVVDKQIKANYKLAQDLQLMGTPALFVGKTDGKSTVVEFIPGQVDQASLQASADKAAL